MTTRKEIITKALTSAGVEVEGNTFDFNPHEAAQIAAVIDAALTEAPYIGPVEPAEAVRIIGKSAMQSLYFAMITEHRDSMTQDKLEMLTWTLKHIHGGTAPTLEGTL